MPLWRGKLILTNARCGIKKRHPELPLWRGKGLARGALVYKARLLCGCEIDWRRGNAIKTSRPFLGYEFRFTADELPGFLTP